MTGMAGLGGGGSMAGGGMSGDHGPGSMIAGEDRQVSEENRKVLEWIAQVLNASTREAALLELSKKREQVPELALILWHSFGTYIPCCEEGGWCGAVVFLVGWDGPCLANGSCRCHDFAASGDYFGVPAVEPFAAYGRGVESGLQCSGVVAVCGFAS